GDMLAGDATRSSDFMPEHFAAFKAITGDAAWDKVTSGTYAVFDTIQQSFSQKTGLIPDFIVKASSAPAPAQANFLEGADDGHFSCNACRVPMRLGLAAALGDQHAATIVNKTNTWIKQASGGDPNNIWSG